MSPDRTRFCWSCWRALRLCPPCCISVCRATPNLEGPRGADSQSDCGAGWYPASQSHNAHHFGQIEIVTVYYRWHPLYGQSLRVQGRKRFPDGEVVFGGCKLNCVNGHRKNDTKETRWPSTSTSSTNCWRTTRSPKTSLAKMVC